MRLCVVGGEGVCGGGSGCVWWGVRVCVVGVKLCVVGGEGACGGGVR